MNETFDGPFSWCNVLGQHRGGAALFAERACHRIQVILVLMIVGLTSGVFRMGKAQEGRGRGYFGPARTHLFSLHSRAGNAESWATRSKCCPTWPLWPPP